MKRKRRLFKLLVIFSMIGSLFGCTSVSLRPAGAVHSFSVSENNHVYFSKGNLQYCPSTGDWKFADTSYENLGIGNENISDDYTGYIDLFGWGATGKDTVLPSCVDTDPKKYGDGHNSIAGTNFDFGVAAADAIGNGWRMLSHDEMHYLLMYRENADKLFGYGTISGIKGLFVLPDDWKQPAGITFKAATECGFENQYNWYYSCHSSDSSYKDNTYTLSEWSRMEKAGAVFLPASGVRTGRTFAELGLSGHYWTDSFYGARFANCLSIYENDLLPEGTFTRNTGLSVRLVCDANEHN